LPTSKALVLIGFEEKTPNEGIPRFSVHDLGKLQAFWGYFCSKRNQAVEQSASQKQLELFAKEILFGPGKNL